MSERSGTKDTTASDQYTRFKKAYDRHEEYVREAKRYDEFYHGQQWKEEDRQALENDGRPALTLNHVLPTINIALGEQVARRAEIRFKAKRRGASANVAHVLTRLTNHILDDNNFSKYIEPQVYSDGLIQDRGYYDIRIDFDDNIEGEVRITSEDPLSVIPDPEANQYDPATWNEVFVTRWMTLDDIAETYGKDKADKIKNAVATEERFDKEAVDLRSSSFGKDVPHATTITASDIRGGKATIRNVRVIERQHMQMTQRRYFVELATGDMRPVPDEMDEEAAEQLLNESVNENGERLVRLISRREKRVRWTVTTMHVTLHDDWSPYRSFTIVPYFPYFRRGMPFGLVRNLIGPQEFLNKSRSQELHIINTTANSGWVVEEGSLMNMTTDELADRGAETGLVLSVRPGTTTAPQKIKPNPVPSGIDRISEKGQMDIRLISGINDAMAGFERAEVSGVALEQKANRGQVQLQVPFASLELSRQFVGRKILELVQDFYTEERVFFITDYSEPGDPQEEMVINQQAAGEIANNITVGEYDVVVSSAPARDTFDEMQFAEAITMKQHGVPVPSYLLVKYSHLAEKEKLAETLKHMEGFAEPTPEEQEMAAMQQQMLLADAQLELEKKQSEVANIQSQAQLNAARTADLVGGNIEKDLAKHAMDMERDRQNLEARMQMSQMSHQASMQKAEHGSRSRMTSEAMKYANNNKLEEFRALTRIAEKQIDASTTQRNEGNRNGD